jgi:hypothetical protein
MLSPQALFKGIVSRLLPQPVAGDGPDQERFARMGRYGDVKVEPSWLTEHMPADEGAYMMASMLPGATALQLGLSAAFSATVGAFVLGNSDVAGGKRLYPRQLRLAQSVAPTSGIDLRYAIVIDSKDRTPTTISSGTGGSGPGTPATVTAYRSPVACVNMDASPAIVGVPFFPLSTAGGAPPTIPSAGPNARTIVGNGYIKNSIPVVKDQYLLNFADVGAPGSFQAAAALAKLVEGVPPIVIGPGQFMVIYLWSAGNITAGNAWDDASLSWIEK